MLRQGWVSSRSDNTVSHKNGVWTGVFRRLSEGTRSLIGEGEVKKGYMVCHTLVTDLQ